MCYLLLFKEGVQYISCVIYILVLDFFLQWCDSVLKKILRCILMNKISISLFISHLSNSCLINVYYVPVWGETQNKQKMEKWWTEQGRRRSEPRKERFVFSETGEPTPTYHQHNLQQNQLPLVRMKLKPCNTVRAWPKECDWGCACVCRYKRERERGRIVYDLYYKDMFSF